MNPAKLMNMQITRTIPIPVLNALEKMVKERVLISIQSSFVHNLMTNSFVHPFNFPVSKDHLDKDILIVALLSSLCPLWYIP